MHNVKSLNILTEILENNSRIGIMIEIFQCEYYV